MRNIPEDAGCAVENAYIVQVLGVNNGNSDFRRTRTPQQLILTFCVDENFLIQFFGDSCPWWQYFFFWVLGRSGSAYAAARIHRDCCSLGTRNRASMGGFALPYPLTGDPSILSLRLDETNDELYNLIIF